MFTPIIIRKSTCTQYTWNKIKLDDSFLSNTKLYICITKIYCCECLTIMFFDAKKITFFNISDQCVKSNFFRINFQNGSQHLLWYPKTTFVFKNHFVTRKVYQKWKLGSEFELVRTLLRITHLAEKLYLVIIYLKSNEKLTKSGLLKHCSTVKLGEVRVSSNITQKSFIWPLGSHIWSILAPIYIKGWANV